METPEGGMETETLKPKARTHNLNPKPSSYPTRPRKHFDPYSFEAEALKDHN